VAMREGEFALIALALATVAAAPAQAENAHGLAPASPWNLVYDDDSCALRRTFGDSENPAFLEMRRFAPGGGLQVIVASKRLKGRDIRSFTYRFGDEEPWRDAGRLKVSLDDGLGGVVFSVPLVEAPAEVTDPAERALYLHSVDWRARERALAAETDAITVSGVTVRNVHRGDMTLRHGSLVAPLAALNECIDELLTHWNIDVEAHKTLARPVLPIDFSAAASMIGYPPKMARGRMQGLVNIRLAIDATGRVTACRIQMPLSDPAFEASSCDDIQHAFEFEPALDKDGKPIASYWTTRVQFQMWSP
jgi:hypothetical protein